MQDQDFNTPPVLPKRQNNNQFVPIPLPPRQHHHQEQQVKPAIVIRKLSKSECCQDHQLAANSKFGLDNDQQHNNNLAKDQGGYSNKEVKFDCAIVNVLQCPSDVTDPQPKVLDTKFWSKDLPQESAMPSSWTIMKEKVKSIFLSFRRGNRMIVTIVLIATACFLLGIALPFIVHKFERFPMSSSTVLPEGLRLRPPLAKADEALPELQHVLNNLFISVKTTHKNHYPRAVILLETWVSLVRSQTWFFSDSVDGDMIDRTAGRIVNTNCSDNHSRTALACKTGSEYDHFLKSLKSWWCHFDDDNYVHVTRLAELLQSFSPATPVYLGKPSTAKPLEVFDLKAPRNMSNFWFATGGAGYCISRTLALKMAPYAADGKFVATGENFWFPDDVTLGFIIEHILGEKLTVVPEFHSHLEPMKGISMDELDKQITFSYISYNGVDNILDLQGPFSKDVDPTRFYSLHCLLYNAPFCPDPKTN